ncbi:hypothetical protein [Anaeromyxobacter paludicola]|uniref:Uncharacterized protein n=1 Tax=Anaeromyxobacter paludicola TaxID=2918171 RepID=A0ABN6N4Z3_9BACT|nr:hypothetical protein [Anaeromyxobacter paludicola]BDG07113.1 hypothetical protein AMPC_02260 [Anaeromyxobacter paludicola]
MARGESYYVGIRGSAAIATAPLDDEAAVARAEHLGPGEMRRVPYAGELLGAARIRAGFVPVPFDAFDRASQALGAEEQAAYLQLLRLSWGEGRNFCRAAKRELMARLALSERRLNHVLDGVVEKGFARPLHRDNRGTLYRVYLPAEAFGEPLGDEVLCGRAQPPPGAADPQPPSPPRLRLAASRPDAAAPAHPARRGLGQGPGGELLALARRLARARTGGESEGAVEAAVHEVKDLFSEGHSPAQVEACIRAVARRAGRDQEQGAAS